MNVIMQRQHVAPSLISKYGALFEAVLRIGDLLIVVLAGLLAYRWRFGSWEMSLAYQRELGVAVLLAIIVFTWTNPYRSWRGRGALAEIARLGAIWTAFFAVLTVYAAWMQVAEDLSRLWLLGWYLAGFAMIAAFRVSVRATAKAVRRNGMDLRAAVVIGNGTFARRTETELGAHAWAGIRVLGHFSDEDEARSMQTPRLGDFDQVADYVARHGVTQVWLALPLAAQDQIDRLLFALRHSTAEIKYVPDLFGMQVLNHGVEDFAGMSVVNLRASPLDGTAHFVKAIEDRGLAALILLLISPLLAVIALGVKLSSPGPALFRQQRHGINGGVIEVWKFRSMRVHAEQPGQVTQARKDDRRVTRFGAFLRRTSLDELPQFLNVLQGTMSIVGPRPHAVAHNHFYQDLVDDYMQRHRVKPGITGWAQVNGLRGETDTVEKMAARVEHDLHYLQNWSLGLDLQIIAMTAVRGFSGRNAY